MSWKEKEKLTELFGTSKNRLKHWNLSKNIRKHINHFDKSWMSSHILRPPSAISFGNLDFNDTIKIVRKIVNIYIYIYIFCDINIYICWWYKYIFIFYNWKYKEFKKIKQWKFDKYRDA